MNSSFGLDGKNLNSTSFFTCADQINGCNAIINSAFPYIALPQDYFDATKSLFEQNGFICPTEQNLEYPIYQSICKH